MMWQQLPNVWQVAVMNLTAARFHTLEEQRKAVQVKTEELQAACNSLSKQIGALKGQESKHDGTRCHEPSQSNQNQLRTRRRRFTNHSTTTGKLARQHPQLPHESVPVGKDETENVEVRKIGTPRSFDFTMQDHVDLGAPLGLDFETGAQLSGARFTLMKGPIARLHRALAQFMLDTHTSQHGYTECYTPYIVNDRTYLAQDNCPNLAKTCFHVTRGGDESKNTQYLIPTAEVTLTNTVANQILSADQLP